MLPHTTLPMPNAPRFSELIETMPGFHPRPHVSHVLFDFDGTLSLIRRGWPEVMIPMLQELLPRIAGDTEKSVRQLLYDDVMTLNGKQTIYQMIRFAERVKQRGGRVQDPLDYKREYLRRLNIKIQGRIDGLKDGKIQTDELLVHGSRDLLNALSQRGLTLYLASGTDECYVREEAQLLEIDRFFEDRIFGATDDYKSFSKKRVIERILREHRISGRDLMAFGDGYVEIENVKQVGGLAVAVASDESHNGSGRMDPWKRRRLKGVGADVVIPDFRDARDLLDFLIQ